MWEGWEGGEATSDKVARKAFLNRECTQCSRHHLCKRHVAEPCLCVRGAESGRGRGRWSRTLGAYESTIAGSEMGSTEPHDQTRVLTGAPGGCVRNRPGPSPRAPRRGWRPLCGSSDNEGGGLGDQERVRRGWLVAMFTRCWADRFRRLLLC